MNRFILRPYLRPEPDLVALAQTIKKQDPIVNPPVPPAVIPVTVQNNAECWSIDGVSYRDNFYVADLGKKLLEDGAEHTQYEWAERAEEAMPKGGLYTPDYPLFYGIVKAAKTAGLEDVRKFLRDTSRANRLMTLTRIQYQPSGEDIIIHNFGTRDRYYEQVQFVGEDGQINSSDAALPYQKLLGTDDNTQEILDVFKWLNGTDTYIFRVNVRQPAVDERVARFCSDSGRAYLSCYKDPNSSGSSLGVRLSRAP
jgi:hypothetical protein